jgi:hypothetical protein
MLPGRAVRDWVPVAAGPTTVPVPVTLQVHWPGPVERTGRARAGPGRPGAGQCASWETLELAGQPGRGTYVTLAGQGPRFSWMAPSRPSAGPGPPAFQVQAPGFGRANLKTVSETCLTQAPSRTQAGSGRAGPQLARGSLFSAGR